MHKQVSGADYGFGTCSQYLKVHIAIYYRKYKNVPHKYSFEHSSILTNTAYANRDTPEIENILGFAS